MRRDWKSTGRRSANFAENYDDDHPLSLPVTQMKRDYHPANMHLRDPRRDIFSQARAVAAAGFSWFLSAKRPRKLFAG